MSKLIRTVVFDLDGTLIDSAPGILAGFEQAFAAQGLTPVCPLEKGIVGPPLMETLALLLGNNDAEPMAALAEAFKAAYDSSAYRMTESFDGVEALLQALQDAGYGLFIATNKRRIPTLKILAHLGWDKFFTRVYSLDSFTPPVKNKTQMLQAVLAQESLPPAETLYIGDRREDGESAEANGMPFLLATWGYQIPDEHAWIHLAAPLDALKALDGQTG